MKPDELDEFLNKISSLSDKEVRELYEESVKVVVKRGIAPDFNAQKDAFEFGLLHTILYHLFPTQIEEWDKQLYRKVREKGDHQTYEDTMIAIGKGQKYGKVSVSGDWREYARFVLD